MTRTNTLYRSTARALCVCITLAGLLLPFGARADGSTVDIEVNASFEPDSALGFVFSGAGTALKKSPGFGQAPDGTWIVSVPYTEEEASGASFATAMLFAAETGKEFAVGDVRLISPENAEGSVRSLPQCEADAQQGLAAFGPEQIATLTKLLTVREKLRAERQASVKALADRQLDENETLLARLTKLEKVFGLDTAEPLSSAMPPGRLNVRLRRLLTAIRNYDRSQPRTKAEPSPSPAAAAPAEG